MTDVTDGARVFAKPRAGLMVPKPGHAPGRPDKNAYLDEAGETVVANRHWRRAAARGDVELLAGREAEKAATAAKPQTNTKPEPEAAKASDASSTTKGK